MGRTGQEGKEASNYPQPRASLDELRTVLLEEWNNISMRRINALMKFMYRRIRASTGGYEILKSESISFCDLGGYHQML